MKAILISVLLFAAGCSDSTPQANAAEAEEHAQQALQQIGDMQDELNNVQDEQNEIEANVQELGEVAADHDDKIKQAQSDIDDVKSRLNM